MSWRYMLMLMYILAVTTFHLVHYLDIRFVVSVSFSLVLAIFVASIASRRKTARQVILLTVPVSFCRILRIYLLSLITGEALFKPVIDISISLLQTSKCTADEGAKSTEKILQELLKAIANKSQVFAQKVSLALQSIVHKSVEDTVGFITGLISGIGIGEVPNPLTELKKEVAFNITAKTCSSVAVKDNAADQISLSVKNYIKDANNTLCLVRILMGVLSIFNVFFILPYTKFKRLQVFRLDISVVESSKERKFKQAWSFIKRCFNPCIGLCFVLPFVVVIETILISSYTTSGDLYAEEPSSLNLESLIHFNNSGSHIGDIIADGLNDIVGSNLTASAAVDINSCFKKDLVERSIWDYLLYLCVLVLASLTYLLEQSFEEEEELLLALADL